VNSEVLNDLAGLVKWIRLTVGAPLGKVWTPQGHMRHLPSNWTGKISGLTVAADTRWPTVVRDRLDECARAATLCTLCYHRVTSVVGREQDLTWKAFEQDMNHLAWLVQNKLVECVTPKEIIG
jgi:hypothetical protein